MRRPVAAVLPLVLGAALLSACAPEAPGGGEALPPADAPPEAPAPEMPAAAPFDQPFALMGTEPFWRLDIVGQTATLTRPDHPDLTAANAGLATVADGAVWTAQAGDVSVIATIKAGQCSDGMSDRVYPYTAEVRLGAETLKGCAISKADFDKLPPA
ncbi:MAG: COG3650 family protein [Caulobacter sp.]